MEIHTDISGYVYENAKLNNSHSYLLPETMKILASLHPEKKRIFELGCGNGSTTATCAKLGYEVLGVDPSEQGIEQANKHFSTINVKLGSAYDDLASLYGQFPIVVSLEVVEHLYFPRKFAKTVYDLLEAGGTAIISTPYHGYWKNIALAVTGHMDAHFTALWEHGHIKFWSIKT